MRLSFLNLSHLTVNISLRTVNPTVRENKTATMSRSLNHRLWLRQKVADCGISDRNILSLEYRPVHNLYITLNRFLMAYIHLHRKEMYYTQFFFIRNVFIRNQYSIFFRIKKPSTHVPRVKETGETFF